LLQGKLLVACPRCCNGEMAELPGVGNAVQSSETLRNSLGLNYKSAALNQLSYAGATHTEAVFGGLIKSSHDPFRAPRCKRVQKFHGIFYGVRMV
jgi:hypothetical protein